MGDPMKDLVAEGFEKVMIGLRDQKFSIKQLETICSMCREIERITTKRLSEVHKP